jgi:hypothetical protein
VEIHLAPHSGTVAAEREVDTADLAADPPYQHRLQLFQFMAGDEVPERAAEALAGPIPAVLLAEAVIAVVDFDQVVLVVDRVAEDGDGDQTRLVRGDPASNHSVSAPAF